MFSFDLLRIGFQTFFLVFLICGYLNLMSIVMKFMSSSVLTRVFCCFFFVVFFQFYHSTLNCLIIWMSSSEVLFIFFHCHFFCLFIYCYFVFLLILSKLLIEPITQVSDIFSLEFFFYIEKKMITGNEAQTTNQMKL
jgi:hypothetical protein